MRNIDKVLRCLIVDEMHDSITAMLSNIGIEADYKPKIRREEILEILPAYQGLIIRSKTVVDEEMLNRGTDLQFIARAGAGLDKIDVELVKGQEVALLNAPEGNADALGEHAVGILLTLFNKINTADLEIRQGIWRREPNRGVELKGKTVGIIGYGHMGSSFASKLAGFGCTVLAYDKNKTGFSTDLVQEATLETLFERADILSLHVPLNEENREMVDAQFLGRFKKPIYIINTARGELLVLRDLLDLLDKGKVLGAALDVLQNEKIDRLNDDDQQVFNRLVTYKNLVLTPHVGGWTQESYRKINQVLVEKIKAHLMTKQPVTVR